MQFIVAAGVREAAGRGGKAGKGAAGGATRYGNRGNFNGKIYEMTWEGMKSFDSWLLNL